jgi:hypothetical protein
MNNPADSTPRHSWIFTARIKLMATPWYCCSNRWQQATGSGCGVRERPLMLEG